MEGFYFSYLNLCISSIPLKVHETWHLYSVAPSLPSSMLGLITAVLMYFTLPNKASCDLWLGELHVILTVIFFSSIHLLELWEKLRHVEEMQFLVVYMSTNKVPLFFSISVLILIQRWDIITYIVFIFSSWYVFYQYHFLCFLLTDLFWLFEIRTCCDLSTQAKP